MKLVGLLLLFAACSSKDHFSSEAMQRPDEPPKVAPSKPTMTVAELGRGCALYAKSTCSILQRCFAYNTGLKYGDGCVAALERECKLVNGVPGSGASEAWLTACAGWSLSASCSEYDRDGGDCKPPPGQFADNAACATAGQCKSGHCKKPRVIDSCGVCAPDPSKPSPRVAGPKFDEKCTDHCDGNLYCDKGKCTAPAPRAMGESCTSDALGTPSGPQPCGPGLWCVGDKDPKCEKRPLDGEACTTSGARCYYPAKCRDGKCQTADYAACK